MINAISGILSSIPVKAFLLGFVVYVVMDSVLFDKDPRRIVSSAFRFGAAMATGALVASVFVQYSVFDWNLPFVVSFFISGVSTFTFQASVRDEDVFEAFVDAILVGFATGVVVFVIDYALF